MGESFIPTYPSREPFRADNAKRNGGDGGRKNCIGNADRSLRDRDPCESGKERDREGANGNHCGRSHNQFALVAGAIDESAKWRTGRYRSDAGDHHDDADLARFPMLVCEQIDGEEGAEPVLDVGQEKVEAVEWNQSETCRRTSGEWSVGGGHHRPVVNCTHRFLLFRLAK